MVRAHTVWNVFHHPRSLTRSDPSIVVVGFSWDGSDERKMRASFDFGRASFGRFVDLSAIAEGLGYDQVGLATLTHRVLGAALPKLRSVGLLQLPSAFPTQLAPLLYHAAVEVQGSSRHVAWEALPDQS